MEALGSASDRGWDKVSEETLGVRRNLTVQGRSCVASVVAPGLYGKCKVSELEKKVGKLGSGCGLLCVMINALR